MFICIKPKHQDTQAGGNALPAARSHPVRSQMMGGSWRQSCLRLRREESVKEYFPRLVKRCQKCFFKLFKTAVIEKASFEIDEIPDAIQRKKKHSPCLKGRFSFCFQKTQFSPLHENVLERSRRTWGPKVTWVEGPKVTGD